MEHSLTHRKGFDWVATLEGVALFCAAPAFADRLHIGVEGEPVEVPSVAPAGHGSISFIPTGAGTQGGRVGTPGGDEAGAGGGGGGAGAGSDREPGGAKKKTPRFTARPEIPATELSFVLFAEANEAAGREVVEQLKVRGNTLVVPVMPLDRKRFTAAVEGARKTFLDRWWPFPRRVSVVVVAPEQTTGDLVVTDEKPWPLASLEEREKELGAIFRDRLPLPAWALLLPVPAKLRCRLPIRESTGLIVPVPKPKFPNRVELTVGLLAPPDELEGTRTAVPEQPHAPDVYRCLSDGIPASDFLSKLGADLEK